MFVLPHSCSLRWPGGNDQAFLPSVGGCGVHLKLYMKGYFVKTKRKLDCVGAAEDMAANAAVSTPISTPPEPHHAKVSTSYQSSLLR